MELLTLEELENLEEFVALPIGLGKKIGSLNGLDFYSSEKLQLRFLETMRLNGRLKPVFPVLERLVKKDKITPAFINKNIFRYLSYRFGPRVSTKNIAGMYIPDQKRIIILMDNNTKLGFTNNDFIALLTMHEAVHMAAQENPSGFMSTFRGDLEDYYFEVFKNIFSLKIKKKPKEIKDVVQYIFKKIEMRKKMSSKLFINYFNMLVNTFSKYTNLERDKFEIAVRDWVVCVKLFWTNPMVVYRNSKTFAHVLGPLAHAYKTLWGKVPQENFFVQEIGTPSEIIAVRSEILLDSKTYKVFKLIK